MMGQRRRFRYGRWREVRGSRQGWIEARRRVCKCLRLFCASVNFDSCEGTGGRANSGRNGA